MQIHSLTGARPDTRKACLAKHNYVLLRCEDTACIKERIIKDRKGARLKKKREKKWGK